MEAVIESVQWMRSLLSGGAPSAGSEFCLDKNVTYAHRVDNPEGWNWCLVPDGGFDAVFFAGLAIAVMCLASPRWDALIVLFFGGIYFTFAYYWNLEHVSNAVMLWLGMRPADIFVFVFLPPFLLDLSVRIDFFMLKKVAFNIAFMAFVMVAASALILIPFMLYALDLKSSGWTAGHVALFGSMIASTDAASVSAVLRSGGGPEILSVLLEGESLFNDASSLTLFEIFKEVVLENERTTLAHDLRGIVVKTVWSAFTGICIGLGMGIFTRWVFAWLQHRNVEAMAEVAWSVAGAYLSFYITQVWCTGSGCIGSVVFGLYGSSTLLWGMSTKARLTGIFNQFWAVMTFAINGLIFFYVGASSVNFTIRSAQTLFNDSGGIMLVKILLYKLPLIFLASFALRFILIFCSFKVLQYARLSEGLALPEVIFVTVGGLRGSLSLVLAQSAATLASTHQEDRRVKAEIAIYTAGYVIMTLLINAPLCGPLLTLLGLDKVRQEQLAMRGEVKNLFRKFTATAIEDLAAGQDEDELLQGLDWAMLKLHTNFDKQLDKELPEVQPRVRWCHCGGWVRGVTAPARLWRYMVACLRGRCNPGTLELDQGEEALSAQRKEAADLRRATNFNLRELRAQDSAAPGAASVPFAAGTGAAPSPTALIIRDPPATASASNTSGSTMARGLTVSSAYSAGNAGSRRQPAPVTAGSLRRSASHRLSTLVVGQPGISGGDSEPSVRNGGFNRSNSRFLEGAVAGPFTGLSSLPSQPPRSPTQEGLRSGGDVAAMIVEQPQIEVVLSAPAVPPGAEQQEEKQKDASGGNGGGGEAGGLVDPELLALAVAQQPGRPGEAAEESPAAGAAAAAAPTVAEAAGGTAASGAVPPLILPSAASGGGGTTAAAVPAADSPDAAGQAPESPMLLSPQGSNTPVPNSSAPSGVSRAVGPVSPGRRASAARPSPLSRGAAGNGPPSGTLSRLHVSTSLPKLDALDQPQAEAGAGSDAGGAGGGAFSEPEAAPSRGARTASAADRGLLQSVLVIKPGALGRDSTLPTSSLGHTASVRLVQRLGDDDGRGSALEALRTDTMSGGRGLGRGSVRLAGPPVLEAATPPAAESEGGSLVSPTGPWSAVERPLGRSSVSAPAAGRPLGRSSGVLGATAEVTEGSRLANWEPPSPFEFALPEDIAAGQARAGGVEGEALGCSSVRHEASDGGGVGRTGAAVTADGGLARQSVRQMAGAAAGGGALGRASVRLGRQAGLTAISTQLARIYNPDSVNVDGQQTGGGRASMPSLEPPPPRGSFATPTGPGAGISPATTMTGAAPYSLTSAASNHIALQVQALQHRESQQQQLGSPSTGGPLAQPQYSLGATGKNVLMSLIRRSASNARSHTDRSSAGGAAGANGVTRDLSGRFSGPELGRRTRFADNTTVAALARASASGALRQSSSEIDGGAGGGSTGMCNPLLVEYRFRLLTGLKQYYKQKHAAGSLSPSAYKVLSYVTDQSAHHPEQPLSLWTMARREISSGAIMEMEVVTYFKLKQWTAAAKSSGVTLIRAVVPRLLVPFVRLLSSHTSAATLRGLETAVELWASLTQSLQTEWLQYSGSYGERLLEEVQHEGDGAWSYIIERRIESPKKFGAVQTHRAVIDVLTQQQAFVREMNEGGMIEESECRKIVEMVEKRLQLLARRGPRWRQPTVMEILMGTAVLRGVSPRVVEWIRKNSTFRVYPQGAAIWDLGRKQAGADGLIIVIRGVVRMMLEQESGQVPYYLGAGGVGGLVSCVLESHVPGMSSAAAYAEGNALGKGPVVMHVPWSVLQVIRRFSREERMAPYQALELQMYRTAAVYVLDLLRQQVTAQFAAFIRSSLLTILASQRLDGPAVRRQRIRLLLQPAAADHIVDGGIDWIGELMSTDLQVAQVLLDPSAPIANPAAHHAGHHHHQHNHHNHSNHSQTHRHSHSSQHLAGMNGGEGAAPAAQQPGLSPAQQPQALAWLAASPWVEVMYKAVAAATVSVLDMIRTSLKDSILVVLAPQQGIIQRSTMVLIQGSLEPAPIADADGTGGAAGVGGPFVASSNELHVAPSVMVWVSDYFEGDLVAQKEVQVVAGPRGATLLLWGVRPEDLLLPSPKAGPAGGGLAASQPLSPSQAAGGGGGGDVTSDGEPTATAAKADPGRGILSVAKSTATRSRQEGGKVKPEVVAAKAAAAALNGGSGTESRKEEPSRRAKEPSRQGAQSPKPAEVNGEG